MAAAVTLGALVSVPTAGAVTGYKVTGASAGLRAHTEPRSDSATVRVLPNGTPLDIACQERTGSTVNGSSIWDRLADGTWVSDYYTSTPIYNGFSPGLPHPCGRAPQPVSREQDAVNRARRQLGSRAWEGLCDKFAAWTYHYGGSGYTNALAHWNDLARRGQVHRGDRNVPLGGLAFFGPSRVNGNQGHVMISLGDGTFVSNGISGKVGTTTIQAQARSAPYLGWTAGSFPAGWGRS